MNKRGYNFICGETSQQINPLYKNSLIEFTNQCIYILRENDIEVSDAKEQKVSDERLKISFKILDKQKRTLSSPFLFGPTRISLLPPIGLKVR